MNVVRALLLTDVVDSTRLSESLGDEASAELWAEHDRAARDLLAVWRGREIDKTDGMLLLFEGAEDAAAYALAYHRALAELPVPLKARAGLHLGSVVLRENTSADVVRGAKPIEVDGLAKPVAARVMSLARGGQTFLTAEAYRSLGATAHKVRSHGHWILKGVAAPIELFELASAEQPFVAPTDSEKVVRVIRVDERWLPVAAVPNNLPQQLASFVGRAKELDEIRRRLESVRLLTLTGSGGCGKTRLALQCAAESLGFHPDGVWLVELAALSNPDLVPQTVATALGLKEQPGKSLTKTVTDLLGPKQVLLVLDNAEHLLDATAQLTEAVLSSCPKATLLVSSREALGIAGEAIYRVPSLTLPDPRREATPESLEGCEAVLLFIVRVRAHTPLFTLSRANAPAVASICQRLDGIPLAIELAVARVRSMAVEEVNQRLDQRFRLLTGGLRTALPRQQTLRSLIDWSYDLLHANEQALFRRLAVFSGGWTLEEAERVCVDEGDDGAAVLDLLGSLVDKSLVVAQDGDGAMRFRTLETVRQYARDRLLESGEVEVWRNRHLSCFVALAEEAGPQLQGPRQQSWLDRLETEHDNLRAALEWCSRTDSLAESGLRLAGALWPFWSVHGYLAEGSGWLSRVLAAAPDRRSEWHASALSGAGELARIQGDHAAARSLQERSLAIRRELGNRRGVAQSLTHLGTLAMRQADYTGARGLIEEGLAIQRELGDRAGLASSLGNLGLVASDLGDFARARVLQEECLAIKREVGDQRGVAIAGFNLGNVAAEHGDYPAARQVFGESLAEFRRIGDTRAEAQVLNNLAMLASDEGEHRAAASLFQQGLVIQHQLGHRLGIAWSLEGLARASLDLADIGRALRLWSGAERLRAEIGAPLSPHQRALVDKHVAAARVAVATDAEVERLWQEGRAMTLDQAVAYALEAPA